jgi:hypothetical protein
MHNFVLDKLYAFWHNRNMMDYKEVFCWKYEELAFNLFGQEEYWKLTPEQQKICGDKAMDAARDYYADQIDAARDRAKYEGLR